MTPLEFVIQAKNADANAAIDQFAQKVEGMKAQTNELYEGPAREMKVRMEVRGMISDLAAGVSPVQSMIDLLMRLGETFRFAMPAAVVITAFTAAAGVIEKMAANTRELREQMRAALAVDAKNESVEQLKKDIEELDKLTEKNGKRGMLETFLFGENDILAGQISRLRDYKNELVSLQDQTQATKLAQAKALQESDNPADQLKGRVMEQEVQNDKEQQQVRESHAAAEAELAKHQAALAALDEQFEARRQSQHRAGRGMISSGDVALYQQTRAELQKNIATDQAVVESGQQELAATVARGAAELAKLKRQQGEKEYDNRDRELARELELEQQGADKKKLLQKDIAQDRAGEISTDPKEADEAHTQELQDRLALEKEQNDEDAKTAERVKEVYDKIAQLRKETMQAQFDALDREQKVVVLRAEEARLEAELKRSVYSATARAEMQKDLAKVEAKIQALTAKTNPYEGLDAETALRGNMASGSFSRVSNDMADRAVSQRDQTNKHLQTIIGKIGGSSLPDAF